MQKTKQGLSFLGKARRCRLFAPALCTGGYLLFFLFTSLAIWIAGPSSRFFGTASVCHWILWNKAEGLLLPAALSILPAFLGKHKLSFTAFSGFLIGIPLGEFFGEVPSKISPERCGGHYEVFVWFAIFLLSVLMGALLEKLAKSGPSWKSRKLPLWCAAYLAGIAGILCYIHFG